MSRLFVRQSLPGRLAAEKRNSKESHHFFVTPLQNQGPETETAAGTALPQPHVPTRPTHHPLTPAREVTRKTDTHLKDPLHYAVRKVKKIKDKKIRTKKAVPKRMMAALICVRSAAVVGQKKKTRMMAITKTKTGVI